MRVLQQFMEVFRLCGKGLRFENDQDSKTFRQVLEYNTEVKHPHGAR